MGGREKRRRHKMVIPGAQGPGIRPALRAPPRQREILLRRQRNASLPGRGGSRRLLCPHARPRLHVQGHLQHQLLQGLAQGHDGKGALQDHRSQEVQLQEHARVFHGPVGEEPQPHKGGEGRAEEEERGDTEGVRLLHDRRAQGEDR